ncbi:hypothetical protein LUZ60_014621 [Juncus effusus]|nr:hypothetical protein LUZ60_014621 [Juncus effusus]
MATQAKQTDHVNLLTLCIISLLFILPITECKHHHHRRVGPDASCTGQSTPCRNHTVYLTDFGAKGDGVTSNTGVFAAAVAELAKYQWNGGGMLVVPAGRYLTGPFNLTSHFTLFLEKDAVILASNDINEYPPIAPLPSYGRGRDLPGPRHSNFIFGTNLTDVIITGNNGTIDGQGQFWWDKFHKNELSYTRGYLVELMFSEQILISNVTFVNSSSWNLHPVYSNNVIISGITILAPLDSPNTDGIDPDSSSNVRIEDVYIVSGDDCVAIKSGWDEYGTAFNMSSQHISVKRLTCVSPTSAVIALGSEMSGGIHDVRAEDITAINSESGVRIKTGVGRGGYVKDIYVRGVNLYTIKWVFWMTGNYGQHPDNNFDPNALPEITNINYSDFYAENVTMTGRLAGIPNDPFKGICISNVTAQLMDPKKLQWNCTDVEGISTGVSPTPCKALQNGGGYGKECQFPTDLLEIEKVVINQCPFKGYY